MKKIMVVFLLSVVSFQQQFSMLRHAGKLLNNNFHLTEFLILKKLEQDPKHIIKHVRLLSEKTIHPELEKNIFFMHFENGTKISLLAPEEIIKKQKDMFKDMSEEGIFVGVLPEDYKQILANDSDLSLFRYNFSYPHSLSMGALISYTAQQKKYDGSTVNKCDAFIGGPANMTLSRNKPEEFNTLKKVFDNLVLKSEEVF